MAILLPVGIQSAGGATSKSPLKYLGQFLFVNPEKMTITRGAGIGSARTMGGTVFQPWSNLPDEVTFEGTLYGIRSLYDIMVLSDSINGSPDYKEVKLTYKWKQFNGLVRNLVVSANAANPRQVNYTMSFVSRDAMDLYRMLVGQLTGAAVERSFIDAQVKGAKEAVKGQALNNMVTVAVLAFDAKMANPVKVLAWRALALLAYGAVFNIGRGKGWRKL